MFLDTADTTVLATGAQRFRNPQRRIFAMFVAMRRAARRPMHVRDLSDHALADLNLRRDDHHRADPRDRQVW